MQRLLGGLLYVCLSAGFFYAWLSPLRPGAAAWLESAGALAFTELGVTLLIGPLLLAATRGRPPGVSRLFAPAALFLQAAAYGLVYAVWSAQSAALWIGLSYAASVVVRTLDVASRDESARLDHSARMIIWFVSLALAAFTALFFRAPWPAWACAVYFLLLAAGEALLPYFRRGVDPRILPEDQLKT